MTETLIFRPGHGGTVTVNNAKQLGKLGIHMDPNALPASWGKVAPYEYVLALGKHDNKPYRFIPQREKPTKWLRKRRETIAKRNLE